MSSHNYTSSVKETSCDTFKLQSSLILTTKAMKILHFAWLQTTFVTNDYACDKTDFKCLITTTLKKFKYFFGTKKSEMNKDFEAL